MSELKMEEVDLSNVFDNPWNSNVMSPENEQKLTESLKRNGSFKPIVVRHMGNKTYQILGGEHRAKVARKLNFETIPAIVHEGLSDNAAKEISISDNARYGSDDALMLSELIGSLDEPELLSDFLPYSDSEVDVLLSSTSIDLDSLNLLDDDEENNIDLDEPTVAGIQTHVIMRFKVPVEDSHVVKEIIDKIVVEQGYSDGDSLTNAGDALVHSLTKS